jgi:glyoxylase-like metal-dependent hydrolase (beta-lactamase superfamily II)
MLTSKSKRSLPVVNSAADCSVLANADIGRPVGAPFVPVYSIELCESGTIDAQLASAFQERADRRSQNLMQDSRRSFLRVGSQLCHRQRRIAQSVREKRSSSARLDKLKHVLRSGVTGQIGATLLLCSLSLFAADQQPRLEYYRVANGFVPEAKNSYGWAKGSGFAKENPWGQYTAFLMLTDAQGQRTWRIEHYLPFEPGPYVSIPDPDTSQGSTMYLLEGSSRALLIDTANPAKATEGVNDLKTVVRYLLAHENDGQPRAHPLDFVVAITHNHPDHIGENGRMSDRTIYYPDLDWPAQAPANYVPIREGGGPTNHGNGTAVSQIDLGNRLVSAVAIPPHSAGSTAYLDAENRLFITGDAIGSAWPYVQGGPLSRYDQSVHHIEEITRPYPDLAVLPAHFYQTGAWARGRAPLNGRPLDRQYITDMAALADGVLAGNITGEPFFAGVEAYWAKNDSAQTVYSLSTLYRPGEAGEPYHAVRIPGNFKRDTGVAAFDPRIDAISKIQSDFYLIRESACESLFLLHGSTSALLIGTGGGGPGLAVFLHSLIGDLPLDVAILDRDPRQSGGLAQLHPRRIYAAASNVLNGVPATVLRDGTTIDLGLNHAGQPLTLEAASFESDGVANLSLLNVADRVLFAGNALEKQATPPGRGMQIGKPEDDQAARSAWTTKMNGRFDLVYLASNARWFSALKDLEGWLAARMKAM